ncbi:hypothetical protein ACF08N_00115 [Streptomyces sp. NPDC015127]|uniref:hypothetical protein n=1 Tax=Streptomyces sp. NPDC015127 TaxID=3364939 RepID=UPI003702D51A
METGFPWGSKPTVDLRLWRPDAIVLFDWLMSTDLNTVPITHPAQKQALADLLARTSLIAPAQKALPLFRSHWTVSQPKHGD